MLNYKVIDATQTIMKKQFNDSPKINGFQSAIFKQNTKLFKKIDKEMVQILHRGSADSGHWFTISTLNCNVFDSAFNDIDKESKKKIVINKETLFCFCRGLYDSEMAKCISCHEWFHLRCLSSREVKHIKDDVTFQYSCSKCLKS